MQVIGLLHVLNRIMFLANCKDSTLGVKQQQWINGNGFVQAVNGNCCIPNYMHTRNKGCGSTYTCSQQILLIKVGMADEKQTLQWYSLLHPYRVYINFASYMIQFGSEPDNFKAGLTRMARTKCGLVDPGDPTQYHCT